MDLITEKFYKCSNNRAFLQDCAPHTHWSVNLNRCDYISVARCKKDGNYHFKLPRPSTRKAKPVQASAIEEIKSHEKPETGDFEIDSRCEGSIDPYKPLHFKVYKHKVLIVDQKLLIYSL